MWYSLHYVNRIYIWERKDWPNFTWDEAALREPLQQARYAQGYLAGRLGALTKDARLEANADALAEEIVRSSQIEAEPLDAAAVRSSIAKRLGIPGKVKAGAKEESAARLMLEVANDFQQPLTKARLCDWHKLLFPQAEGPYRFAVGKYRDDKTGPMQVVSGPMGREKVHFEPPAANRLAAEMKRFLTWFASDCHDPLMQAGIAHLWLVTLHPFGDGNGRLARAVTELALARSEGSSERFFGMSREILRARKEYYDVLERTQRGGMDVTPWLLWFLDILLKSIKGADEVLSRSLRHDEFWRKHSSLVFSERQTKVLRRLLGDFEGNLTTKKWAALAKCSVPTAQRDINGLIEKGVLSAGGGGSKNTCYEIVEPNECRVS